MHELSSAACGESVRGERPVAARQLRAWQLRAWFRRVAYLCAVVLCWCETLSEAIYIQSGWPTSFREADMV